MDASYCLCVLLFGKQIHEPISLQGDTFLWFYPVFLSSCSVMLSRCASRGEERGQSGTFYTPRPVVAFMCREALAAYLTRETSIVGEPLGWLLDEAETGEPVRDAHIQPLLNTHSLPRTLRERVDR